MKQKEFNKLSLPVNARLCLFFLLCFLNSSSDISQSTALFSNEPESVLLEVMPDDSFDSGLINNYFNNDEFKCQTCEIKNAIWSEVVQNFKAAQGIRGPPIIIVLDKKMKTIIYLKESHYETFIIA